MTDESTSLESRVIQIVAEALDVNPSEVRLHSSLIDDLGAESIDFLDILFRIETAFDVRIEENEIWRGSIEGDDPESIRTAVDRLKSQMPDFRWDRLPATMTKTDLPRLITIQTIVEYLQRRLAKPADAPAGGGG